MGGHKDEHFGTQDEMLTYLVRQSDNKIDQIIHQNRDVLVSHDPLVPTMCYDLLMENAEPRKMCNIYQLKVLLMTQKHEKRGQIANTSLQNGCSINTAKAAQL